MKAWRTNELVGGVTANELARLSGRSIDSARSAARRHGIKLTRKTRGYPPAVKNYALAMLRHKEPLPRIAKATGVSLRTVQSWVSQQAKQQPSITDLSP